MAIWREGEKIQFITAKWHLNEEGNLGGWIAGPWRI